LSNTIKGAFLRKCPGMDLVNNSLVPGPSRPFRSPPFIGMRVDQAGCTVDIGHLGTCRRIRHDLTASELERIAGPYRDSIGDNVKPSLLGAHHGDPCPRFGRDQPEIILRRRPNPEPRPTVGKNFRAPTPPERETPRHQATPS